MDQLHCTVFKTPFTTAVMLTTINQFHNFGGHTSQK